MEPERFLRFIDIVEEALMVQLGETTGETLIMA
jgi:hypothetical protein